MTDPIELAEAWILAGLVDGRPSYPLLDDVAGIPYVLRLACDAALAGATRIVVVWTSPAPPPELASVAADPRLASRASLELVREAPNGRAGDGILVVRADRACHRDTAARVAASWRAHRQACSPSLEVGDLDPAAHRPIVKLDGAHHDAIVATDRRTARALAACATPPRGLSDELARLDATGQVAIVEPPDLAFTMPLDRTSKGRAERRLVWSLRKSADGIVSKIVNRRVSLPITWLSCRTRIHPNHATLVALACALAGAVVIARGGYLAGVIGMLLVELGSIVDGVDGELARLRFQFSRTGQWLDTVVDDVSNVAYAAGVTANLAAAGVAWAIPVDVVATVAFAITQSTQYVLVKTVYRSGDLAAIPWAFQSSERLSRHATGPLAWIALTVPKLFKRDFVVTLYVVLAIAGRLDLVLLSFAGGAAVFFVGFAVQATRNRRDIMAAYRQLQAAT